MRPPTVRRVTCIVGRHGDALLQQKENDAKGWQARRDGMRRRAARFDWKTYAGQMACALLAGGAIVKVLHLGKFYPPAKGGMETILRLICLETANHVQNRVLVANDGFVDVEERHGGGRGGAPGARGQNRRGGRLSRVSGCSSPARTPISSCCTSRTRWRLSRISSRGPRHG